MVACGSISQVDGRSYALHEDVGGEALAVRQPGFERLAVQVVPAAFTLRL